MNRSLDRSLVVAVSSLFVLTSAACGNGGATPSRSQRSAAAVAPPMGTTQAFSVLAGESVTNTGPSTLNRDLGVSPGTAITGFPPGLLLPPAARHAADATALQAKNDLTTAYLNLAAQPCNSDKSGTDLGGLTFGAGVYCFSSDALLTGELVLDAENVPDAVFIFQIGSTLTTASNASVRLDNGALPCNVYWQVGSSATVGTTTSFKGNILALTSIALKTGANLDGRALARNGSVTLDSNQITSMCGPVSGGDGGTGGGDGGAGGGDGGTGGGDGGTPGGGDGGVGSISCCEGAKLCGSICANLQTDANHCGSCDKRCSASEVCSAGACAPCPSSQAQCKDQCADLKSDPFNCGACGKACAPSQSCMAGSCAPCDGTLCSNTCVELSTDPFNCGACGNVCGAGECCQAGTCSASASASKASCKQR